MQEDLRSVRLKLAAVFGTFDVVTRSYSVLFIYGVHEVLRVVY